MFIKSIESLVLQNVVTEQTVTEWQITKTEARNEKEIFITLIKYITHQRRESEPLLVGNYLLYK